MPLKASPDSFGFMMTETARLLRAAFERRISEAGLEITPAEARTLVHVAAGEGARQNNIADRMGVEPMTVCAYLDRLEKLNLVARTQDPSDRRAKNVRTTDDADRTLASIRHEADDLYEQVLQGIDQPTREIFLSTLKTLRDNLYTVLADKVLSDKAQSERVVETTVP